MLLLSLCALGFLSQLLQVADLPLIFLANSKPLTQATPDVESPLTRLVGSLASSLPRDTTSADAPSRLPLLAAYVQASMTSVLCTIDAEQLGVLHAVLSMWLPRDVANPTARLVRMAHHICLFFVRNPMMLSVRGGVSIATRMRLLVSILSHEFWETQAHEASQRLLTAQGGVVSDASTTVDSSGQWDLKSPVPGLSLLQVAYAVGQRGHRVPLLVLLTPFAWTGSQEGVVRRSCCACAWSALPVAAVCHVPARSSGGGRRVHHTGAAPRLVAV